MYVAQKTIKRMKRKIKTGRELNYFYYIKIIKNLCTEHTKNLQ